MDILNKKAFSVLEYAVLLIIIMGAFLVMRNYIQRGIWGNWGSTGQSFASGRQYDSQKTVECSYDPSVGWYDRNCFDSKMGASQSSKKPCDIGNSSCVQPFESNCRTPYCS